MNDAGDNATGASPGENAEKLLAARIVTDYTPIDDALYSRYELAIMHRQLYG